jgi:hypothetical protein
MITDSALTEETVQLKLMMAAQLTVNIWRMFIVLYFE